MPLSFGRSSRDVVDAARVPGNSAHIGGRAARSRERQTINRNGERLLLTVAEVAERLSLSASLLYQMARRDELPAGCVTRIGRAVRLNWPRMQQWAEAGGTAADD